MYGIYFIEPNQSIVADFEGYFLMNSNTMKMCGCSGIFSEALSTIQKDPSVNVIVIAQELTDMDCLSALKQLGGHNAIKIVCINQPDEILQQQITNLGAKVIIKPYSFADLSNTISHAAPSGDSSSQQSAAETPPQSPPPVSNPFNPAYTAPSPVSPSYESAIKDNPFANIGSSAAQTTDIKEQLRQVRREKPNNNANHLLPQQVIAVHNQKGGVGKTTLAKELAIAMRRFNIVKGGQSYQPKVCLCDFDLGASDIVSVLNLPPTPNISTWYNDLHTEAKRIGAVKGQEEPVENIRFTEQQILDRYLIRHETGIYVLAAPDIKRDSTEIRSEDISAIIDNLKACGFDFIIMDTGPNILGYTLMALLKADMILAVTTCEISSVSRLNSIIRDIVNVPGFNPNKIKLVVNMYDGGSNIKPEEIVDLLHVELIGTIPRFSEIGNINNEGYSVFYNRGSHDQKANAIFADTINKLAKRIANLDKRGNAQTNRNYNGTPPRKKSFWQKLFGG